MREVAAGAEGQMVAALGNPELAAELGRLLDESRKAAVEALSRVEAAVRTINSHQALSRWIQSPTRHFQPARASNLQQQVAALTDAIHPKPPPAPSSSAVPIRGR